MSGDSDGTERSADTSSDEAPSLDDTPPAELLAEQAAAAEAAGPFGAPGKPLTRSPFLVGLTARLGLSRGLAVTVVALGGLLVGCGGLFALVPPMIRETLGFIDAVPGYIESLRNAGWIEDFNERYDVLSRLQDALTADNLTIALGGVLTGAGIVFGQLFNILTVGVLTLYFLGAV